MQGQAAFAHGLHWVQKNNCCLCISWNLVTYAALIARLICYQVLSRQLRSQPCQLCSITAVPALLGGGCRATPPQGSQRKDPHMLRARSWRDTGGCSASSLAKVALLSSTASRGSPKAASPSPHFMSPWRKLSSPGQDCHQGSVIGSGSSGSITPGVLPSTSGTSRPQRCAPWQLTQGLGLPIPDNPASSSPAHLYSTHTRDSLSP